MAIQISGTTVIDNSRNLTNIASIFSCTGIASQAEAEAGSSSTKLMTPQRVAQAISALGGGGVINRIQRGTTTVTSPGGNSPWLGPTGGNADGGSSTTVTITSVDTGKTFLSSSVSGAPGGKVFHRGMLTPSPGGIGYGGIREGGASVELTNATTITIKGGQGGLGVSGNPSFSQNFPGFPSSNYVSWEVIEFA